MCAAVTWLPGASAYEPLISTCASSAGTAVGAAWAAAGREPAHFTSQAMPNATIDSDSNQNSHWVWPHT